MDMHDFFRWKYWNPKRLYNVKDIRLFIPFSWACVQSSSFLFSLLTLNVNIHNMVAILIFLKEFKYSPIECVYVCTHAHAHLTKRRKKQSHFGANIIFIRWSNEAQFLVFIPSKFCPCYWAYIFLNQKNIVEVMLCWLGLKAYYLWL